MSPRRWPAGNDARKRADGDHNKTLRGAWAGLLMADLSRRVDAVITQIGNDELEVSLLGSRTLDADVAELREQLRAWGRSGATVSDE